MKRKITFRLLVMLLTAAVLLSSTGLSAMLASAEVTDTSAPAVSNPVEETTAPEVTAEGGKPAQAGPSVSAGGGALRGAQPMADVTWLGVDGTTADMGKATNPYDVSDVDHFLEMNAIINDIANGDKYFRLTADIDLTGIDINDFKDRVRVDEPGFGFDAFLVSTDWKSSSPNIFVNLDGNGFKIKNLSLDTGSKVTCALFGYLNPYSEIYDIRFEDCAMTVNYSSAKSIALVAVQNLGVIDGCSFAGISLNMSGTQGDTYASATFDFSTTPVHTIHIGYSATVGDNQGTVSNCRYDGVSISVNRRNYVGVVAAQNNGDIIDIDGSGVASYGVANLTMTASSTAVTQYMGGITGRNYSGGVLDNCTVSLAAAASRISYGTFVGGIAGGNAGAITDCYVLGKTKNTDTISASTCDLKAYGSFSGAVFGGIAGTNSGTISATSAENVGAFAEAISNVVYGGIAGNNSYQITNCYASGKQSDGFVLAAAGYYTGGIVGNASAGTAVSGCYALVSLSPRSLTAGALLGNGGSMAMLTSSYWSSAISGWPTQCALNGADNNDLTRSIDTINVNPNAPVELNKSVFAHSWGTASLAVSGITTATAFSENSEYLAIAETSSTLEVTGVNTILGGFSGRVLYTLAVQLPAGVGASRQGAIAQGLFFDTVITSTTVTEPVVSRANPIVITTVLEAELMRTVNSADYRLAGDLTLTTGDWGTPSLFYGTLDGNGKQLTIGKDLFSKIYGSRDDTVPENGQPDKASNLAAGYIHDLNLYLTGAVTTGVLGTVVGATIKNVRLTGNTSAALNLTSATASNTGAFINSVRGSSYIYGCFTDIRVNINNAAIGNIAGLIGLVDAVKTVVDNCGSNSFVYSANNNSAIGSFIGGITENTGTVRNSYVGGLVQRGGHIAIGTKMPAHKVENLYWSINDLNPLNQSTILPSNFITGDDSFFQWAFNEGTGYISNDVSYLNIVLPLGISALADSATTDFSIAVADADKVVIDQLNIVNRSVGGNTVRELQIQMSRDPAAVGDISTSLTLTHVTGLKARINIQSGISKDIDGYYQIRTPGDLQYFSDNQTNYFAEGSSLKVKIVNDLDMTGCTIDPIGHYESNPANQKPFMGVFDGNEKTISNLTMTGAGDVALFGYTEGATISNITLDNASITSSNQYNGILVAVAKGGIIGKNTDAGITVTNSSITVTYGTNNESCTGGVVGAFIAHGTAAAVTNITVDNLDITAASSGYIGGVAGKVLATAVTFGDIAVNDLTILGTWGLGGVVGQQVGDVDIDGVEVTGSEITGTGYVGGVVGQSQGTGCAITGATVNGCTLANTGTALTSTAATGGIAGWFSGTIGDASAECFVTGCDITGMAVGGVVGRADTTAGNRGVTVQYCTVGGGTVITATATESAAVAGGIFGDFVNSGSSSVSVILDINHCYVQNSVAINNGRSTGGILGTASHTGTMSAFARINITNCQSFAAITTSVANSYAAAIVGSEYSNINYVKIHGCVAGGSVSSANSAGGIVGYHNNNTVFNIDTALTAHITGCYVTATVGGATNNGKIWGHNSTVPFPPFTQALSNTVTADAINGVVISTYPQNLANFGRTAINNYDYHYDDINKPDAAHANYQHGSATPVALLDDDPGTPENERTATINVTNLPSGFTYVSGSGWVSESEAKVLVTGYTATTVDVEAVRTTTTDTGVVAWYENSGFTINPDGTEVNIAFQARIPVSCTVTRIWPGTGTQGDPYQIITKYDLDELRSKLVTDPSAYYKIMDDIEFTEADYAVGGDFYNTGKGFLPIPVTFTGHLDGNYKTVTGLNIVNTGGVYTGLFEQADGAEFKNLTIDNAVILGDTVYCNYGGVLVAQAVNTDFTGIHIENSALDRVLLFAGGIVGHATGTDVAASSVEGTTVTGQSGSAAGGVAGSFGGTVGAPSATQTDMEVTDCIISGGYAGGVVGLGNSVNLSVNYALVSGGSVTSAIDDIIHGAGGILGYATGPGDYNFNILHSKVDSTAVSAVRAAGGILGKMAVTSSSVLPVNLLNIDGCESYATVTATGGSTLPEAAAGGIVGRVTNALIVKIAGGAAGGSVSSDKYAGGVIGFIEGNDTKYSLFDHYAGSDFIQAINSLVADFVVSADVFSDEAAANMGLILGYADTNLFSNGGYYNYPPFSNVKYSSYQHYAKTGTAPYKSGAMVGSAVNNYTEYGGTALIATVLDLNKGHSDNWTSTYKGLRHHNGEEETMTLVLGSDPVVLDSNNMRLPELESFPVNSGDFTSFTDSRGLSFVLDTVTSDIPDLVTYDKATNTLSKVPGSDNAGDLIFRYENGLELALMVVAFDGLEGDGTEEHPYQISRVSLLALPRLLPTKYYEQTADLTFAASDFQAGGAYYNGGLLWEPIAKTGGLVFFTGEYNGLNHTITGLKVDRPGEEYVGLFKKLGAGSKVYNLTIAGAAVTGKNFVGALAGEVLGNGTETTVSSVTVTGSTVTAAYATSSALNPVIAGGITGREYGGVNAPAAPGLANCSVVSTTVTATAANYGYAAGIAGTAHYLTNCDINNVTVNASYYASGIMVRSSIASVYGGAGYPIVIEDCDIGGASKITSTSTTLAGSIAAGAMCFINKRVQASLTNCRVSPQTTIKSNRGTAAGLFGVLMGPTGTNDSLTLTVTNCRSFANITAYSDIGGILGGIKGQNIPLANILIDGCAAGGELKATNAVNNVGGIIGIVDGSSFITTSQAFIKDCFSSVFIVTATGNRGKFIGNCADISNGFIAENDYPAVFYKNYTSSYPQNYAQVNVFGDAVMCASQQIPLCVTDLMQCRQPGDTYTDSFTVQYVIDGQPEGDYRPVAIATYDAQQAVTTHFRASLQVWNGSAPVELAANEPFTISAYHSLAIEDVNVTTTALLTDSFVGEGAERRLHFGVTPTSKQAGQIELTLSYGIQIAVPLVTFEISGNGTSLHPFEIESAEHITLLYYLPNVYYIQTADIDILPADYQAGGVLYNEGTAFQGLGFMPIGTQAKPFTGSYDGQNHTITGLTSVNKTASYVGFFGNVAAGGRLKNIHLELTENGSGTLGGIAGLEYVGGLAGYCASASVVENCSVAKGNVAGRFIVGGLIGYCASDLLQCFTATDVLAVGTSIGAVPGEAGGLVGRVENLKTGGLSVTIDSCFATGSVYSGYNNAGVLVGRANCQPISGGLLVRNAYVAGDVKSGGSTATYIAVGSGSGQGSVTGENILVAGTNVSFNPSMNPFTARNPKSGYTNQNIYFDNNLLGLAGTSQGTAKTTADLTDAASQPALFGNFAANWTASAGSYPRLKMKDAYSNAFAALAAVPIVVNAKEFDNGNTLANGAIYPVKVAATVGGGAISLATTKLDPADTVPYPAAWDPNLTGNGTDRSVDLLFSQPEGGTRTIFRNIFKSADYPTPSSLVALDVEYGELWYDTRTPAVTMTAAVNGVDVARSFKLPLESVSNTFYVATERQFRALESTYETNGTKFYVFSGATGADKYSAKVYLTADVNLRGNETGSEFEPIQTFKGTFEGNGMTIRNLRIVKGTYDYIGLFTTLDGANDINKVSVNNLNVEITSVTGRDYIGGIAGSGNLYSLLSNCKVYSSNEDSVVTGRKFVGGLIGSTTGTVNNESSAAVAVAADNVAGGLIGKSSGIVTNCFAYGSVTGAVTNDGTLYGIGGLAGVIDGGSVTQSFATGNILVTSVADFTNQGATVIGVGGFAGSFTGGSMSSCFASGNVRAEDVGTIKNTETNKGSLSFGTGGFVGVATVQLSSCYSSSSVFAEFTGEVSGAEFSRVAAGVGGVAGVATAAVSDAYSSGSVFRGVSVPGTDIPSVTYFDDAMGGVIGTTCSADGSLPAGYQQLYFDIWNNSYGSDFKPVGNITNAIPPSQGVLSLTTDQLCISQQERVNNPNQPLQLSDQIWSFNKGAYPCLLTLVQSSSLYIRYPAVLSVVVVTPDVRDTSARSGNGITMALTTPNSLTVLSNTYNLHWTGAADSEVNFIEDTSGGGTVSKFVPVRTGNYSQNLSLIAQITGYEEYGSRRFDKLCAEMLGTQEKPYLISNKTDLQHIGLPEIGDPEEYYNVTGFDNFYNTWYSPITIDENKQCTNIAGKIYFRLLSNIDMRTDVTYTYDPVGGKLTSAVDVDGDGNTANDNHYIPSLLNVVYQPGITFAGIEFQGNDYSIDYFNSAQPFLKGISPNSQINNIVFNNLTMNAGSSTAGTALVELNYGTIDGCIVHSGTITAGGKAAAIVAENHGTITNSVSAAAVTGADTLGGIAAVNGADGVITNCLFNGSIVSTQAADLPAKAGGIAGVNSAEIADSFTLGSVTSANGATVLGGFVGENAAGGEITGAYSRTAVTGKDNVGGFAGTNAGSVTNAFSAGLVTAAAGAAQQGIFCGTNTGTLTDTFADKALSGKSTYKLYGDYAYTEDIADMGCFDTGGSASSLFTASTGGCYPQLTAILALDDAYAVGEYVPLKVLMLIAYSAIGSATVNTQYAQYVDTLAVGSANPLSTVARPGSGTRMTEPAWSSSAPAVASVTGTTNKTLNGVSAGTAVVTVSAVLTDGNGLTHFISLPITVTVGAQNPNFADGAGSSASPYQIGTTAQFDSLAYYGADPELNYILTSDLDYNGGCPEVPIVEFNGNLDGGKYVVYDLTVDNNAGLFGFVNSGGSISNLGLVGANMTASTENYAGLLAGQVYSATVENCYAVGNISVDALDVGGLVGLAANGVEIIGCATSGKVTNTSASVDACVGGVVGSADFATVTDCLSTAYVAGGTGNIGGIAGALRNSSICSENVFAGMAVDAALAGGGQTPAAPVCSIAGAVFDESTVTDCLFDKQFALYADDHAQGMYTGELSGAVLSGWAANADGYAVAAGLNGGGAKFTAGLAFITMPIEMKLGGSAGSVMNLSSVQIPAEIAGDTVTVTEIPRPSNPGYFTIVAGAGSAPTVATMSSTVDMADVFTGLAATLDTGAGALVFPGMANTVSRYVEPRLARIVAVDYTLTNSSGATALNTDTVAIQIKNEHIFAGEPMTYSSDAFTYATAATPAVFEDLVVSSGSIYAGGKLPKGYAYEVTAVDQNSLPLTVTESSGEYGFCIALAADTTAVTIRYNIVSYAPWGVYRLWDSLIENLVQ